jgi:hypothetical protein
MLLGKDFVMQGGVRNYLGKTKEITAPKYWKSSKDSPKTELAYITEAEKGLLLDANLHGSLKNGQPNVGASGLLSYDGWGDRSDGFGGGGGSSSGGGGNSGGGNGGGSGGGRQDTESQYGSGSYGSYDSSQNVSDRDKQYSGGSNNDYKTPDPQLPPGVTDKNFDYETEAYSNVGQITDATYDAKTGEVNIEQTPGVVNTEQYQTSSLGAFLDSPDVSEKEKIDTLDRIQALENSNIVGSKLSNLETDFVLGNLTKSLDNIKSDSKYNDLTSKIDLEGKTVAKDFQDAPLETFFKSGGILGSIIRAGFDQYKNNQVLELLGYTGKTIKYNPDGSGDFNYTGYPNINVGRDEVNTLAPMAPYAVQGTTPLPSVAQKYFDQLPQGSGLSFQAAYDAAKTKVNQTLGNPSAMGLLAVNESPFYDFLKIRGLDRRIL